MMWGQNVDERWRLGGEGVDLDGDGDKERFKVIVGGAPLWMGTRMARWPGANELFKYRGGWGQNLQLTTQATQRLRSPELGPCL